MSIEQRWTQDLKPLVETGMILFALAIAGTSFVTAHWLVTNGTSDQSQAATFAAVTFLVSSIAAVLYFVVYISEWSATRDETFSRPLFYRTICFRLILVTHWLMLVSTFLFVADLFTVLMNS